MTTIYVPRLIESAEQAEALPEGTVLIREDHFAFQKHAGRFVSADPHDLPVAHAWEVVGWTALVPIEAEEERLLFPTLYLFERKLNEVHRKTRLVTPWEEM